MSGVCIKQNIVLLEVERGPANGIKVTNVYTSNCQDTDDEGGPALAEHMKPYASLFIYSCIYLIYQYIVSIPAICILFIVEGLMCLQYIVLIISCLISG